MKLSKKIEHTFSAYSEKPAVSLFSPPDKIDTVTYKELAKKVRNFSSVLLDRGMKPGDFVVSYMNKSPLTVEIIFAVLMNLGTPCNLNAKLKTSQVLNLCAKHKPVFVFLDKHGLRNISTADDAHDVECEFLFPEIPVKSKMTSIMLGKASKLVNIETLDLSGENRPDQRRRPKTVPAEAPPGICLFTSGSTGEQKGVLISRDDLCQRADVEIRDYGLSEKDRLLSLLPFSFDVGLNQLLSCFFSGGHLVIMNSWFPKDITNAVKVAGITGISGVPAIWADMLSYAKPSDFRQDTKALRYITVSGGDLSAGQLEDLKKYWEDAGIYKTYGQTEAFRSGILKPGDFAQKMTSVGKAPKGSKVFVLDKNFGIAPPNTEGEIVHCGIGKMIGYKNDPDETSEKKRKRPDSLADFIEDGEVVFTGDRGRMDEDGYLYVLGRKDGMVKIAGNRVYPREIETCLLEHGGVKKVAAVGVEKNGGTKTIVVEIVPNGELDAEEAEAFLKKRLPTFMIPDEIHIVVDLPMTETGKTRYSVIREKYEKR